jgi:F-box protein 18 (helicase)
VLNFNKTSEQIEISNSKARIIKVLAFAGTGKTTSLLDIAYINNDKRILYIAFNDIIVKEARTRFPENVTVKTSHSLAYSYVGKNYKKRIKDNFSIYEILNFLLLKTNNTNLLVSKTILKVIRNFCNSEIDLIDNFDYPEEIVNIISKNKFNFYVKIVFNKMFDYDSELTITHDFYLKRFQIENIKLDFDIILFDEVQDCDAPLKKIILNQINSGLMQLFLVGDNYQNIYGFRGTINIFNDFKKDSVTLPLTKSFRFGKNIAKLANKLININRDIDLEYKIEGNHLINDKINKINYENKISIICRTNAMVLGCALEQIKKNKKIFFGNNYINKQQLIDIYNIKNQNYSSILTKELRNFKSLIKLKDYASKYDKKEIIYSIKVVESIKFDFFDLIKKLNDYTVDSYEKCDIYLGTAHKLKGKEFDQVILTNDYIDIFDKTGKILDNIKQEEINILYVAMTRAKYNLQLNKTLEVLLRYEK